jgi:hypothetical protein
MLVRFRYLTNEPTTAGEMTEQVFEGTVRLRSSDGITWEWVDEKVRSPFDPLPQRDRNQGHRRRPGPVIDEASLTRFVTLDEEGYFVMDGLASF